ncbi:MAG: hypothetical protein WCG23_08640 [bacterium]
MNITPNRPSFSANVNTLFKKEVIREISPTAESALDELILHAKHDGRDNLSLEIGASKRKLRGLNFPVNFVYKKINPRINSTSTIPKLVRKVDATNPYWNKILSSGKELIREYEEFANRIQPK